MCMASSVSPRRLGWLIVAVTPAGLSPFFSEETMILTQLNHECLLHLFSFLDKDSRKRLSLACPRLRRVFLDPQLWTALRFGSPAELRRDNFVLGASLRSLAVSWHSSRVRVCSVEDWLKSPLQRDICRSHQGLVSTFLDHVRSTCPNLLSLTLSGCGHITDQDVVPVLRGCGKLRCLHLEYCARLTDVSLEGAALHGYSLRAVRVDFCRSVTQAGLRAFRESRPDVQLSAVRSGGMIPDRKPEAPAPIKSALQKVLLFS